MFFRDVCGWYEDKYIVMMGGPDNQVEADGTFVIGKRKNAVGRMRSKEHVYVITQRASRKIRRIVVKDKTADVLSVFDKHLLPNTTIMVDPGTENNHFKNLELIRELHEIPGPIHVDTDNAFLNTQTVESSHSGIKMRLRLGRGLPRHNLQGWLDFEDFLYNRTNGTPQDIFKKLGDAATTYVATKDFQTVRNSHIPDILSPDILMPVNGLSHGLIKTLCSVNVFKKARRFEVKKSTILSTQVFPNENKINGSYKAVKIYDQQITWGESTNEPIPFSLATLAFSCSCAFFKKDTPGRSKCCKHIIGHLRRVLFNTI